MTPYRPPLDDLRFLLETFLQAPQQWERTSAFAHVDASTAAEVLHHAGVFVSKILWPLNASGDHAGCHHGATVRTPAGFPEAYQAFVVGGWAGLGLPVEIGGQGMPQVIDLAFHEMQVAANHAFAMYPGLLHGAVEAIRHHAAPPLRDKYLPRLVSGEWLAAMGLTEAQAGSDLSLVRTRARAQADGSVLVDGEKLFMSGGDHDLTDNIIHLVICRLDDAPQGIRGLSLVLVPKVLPDGARNSVVCSGIERKLGLHASATCSIQYVSARGWVVGEPNEGLRSMFLMMNSARLRTGVQGIAHADAALQNAEDYARDRLQGRVPGRERGAAAADPIEAHPAVQRKLAAARAFVEGARAVAAYTAMRLDDACHHADTQERAAAEAETGILTPVIKAFLTQQGFRHVNEILQVFGGYGYVAEYGIEQKLRDCRSSMIYEGTNEIQAIDLLVRKVLSVGGHGASFERLLDMVEAEARAGCRTEHLGSQSETLLTHCAEARRATAMVWERDERSTDFSLWVADDFLNGVGWLLLGWGWIRSARLAQERGTEAIAQRKMEIACDGFHFLLDEGLTHWRRVQRGRPSGCKEFAKTAG